MKKEEIVEILRQNGNNYYDSNEARAFCVHKSNFEKVADEILKTIKVEGAIKFKDWCDYNYKGVNGIGNRYPTEMLYALYLQSLTSKI